MDRKTIKNLVPQYGTITLVVSIFALIASQRCASRKYISKNDFGNQRVSSVFERPTRITIGNESNFGPSLSPNGSYVFYTSDRQGNKDIYVKKTRGGYASSVTNHPADDFSPVMSPNGKRLAFVSRRANAAGAIHVADTGNTISNLAGLIDTGLITVDLKDFENRNPAWFPDSNKIVFSSRIPGTKTPRLYLADLGDPIRITPIAEIYGDYPAVNDDGSKIAYSRNGALFCFDMKTTTETQLTDGTFAQDGHPQFMKNQGKLIFIRYADDTNDDNVINAEDRPTIWSLDIDHQIVSASHLENFRLVPLTSASKASFYPRHVPPFIYFATEDSDSLDIYRLPEFGHTQFHNEKSETYANFEALEDEDEKIYVLRHDAAAAEIRGDHQVAAELTLKELDWLVESSRNIEAQKLALKIQQNFSDLPSVIAEAQLSLLNLEIAPWRYPEVKGGTSEVIQAKIASWQSKLDQILIKFENKPQTSPRVIAKGMYLRAELEATAGGVTEAKKILRTIAMDFNNFSDIASVALYYKADLEISEENIGSATQTVIELIQKFPQERTVASAAARELTTSINRTDRDGQRKLAEMKATSKAAPLLSAYAMRRAAILYRASGKNEAANNEFRSLVKESKGAPELVISAAKDIVAMEEAAARYSVALAVLDDLHSNLKRENSDKEVLALQMKAEFYVRRGRVLLASGESGAALRAFRQALEFEGENISANEGLIDVQYSRDEGALAIKSYRELVSEAPNSAQYKYLLAYAIQQQKSKTATARNKDLDESLALLEDSRQLNGQIPEIHLLLGRLYLEKAHIRRAIFRSASFRDKINRSFMQTKSFLGFPDPNWYELSIDSSLTAYFLSSPTSVARAALALQLSDTYFENQSYHLSLRYYTRRISMLRSHPIADPKDEMKLFRHAGRAAFFAEELELANTLQRKSLALATTIQSEIDIAYGLDALALTLREQKRFSEAKILYSRLLEIHARRNDPNNQLGTRINLGYCAVMTKEFDAALDQYSKAEALLGQLNTEKRSQQVEAITIDLAGQNSAAHGFSALDRRLQLDSFRAIIYSDRGEYGKAIDSLTSRINLLNDKRAQAKKLGQGATFMSEELSISHNNNGYFQALQGQLKDAASSFENALSFAKTLRDKNQSFPARSEWLNLLDLARVELRRADTRSLPNERKRAVESRLDEALNELKPQAQLGNRDAILASAALNAISAQLLSVDDNLDETRRATAQSRFQESIILAQKIGIDSRFTDSANLNLDREAASENPQSDEIFASQSDFRRSAMVRPGIAWKYLATRGLCKQAVTSMTSFVSSGGRILENDLSLLKTCVDSELKDTGKIQPHDAFTVMRQYFFIESQFHLNAKLFPNLRSFGRTSKDDISRAFTIGRFERISAALEENDGLLSVYQNGDQRLTFVLLSGKGLTLNSTPAIEIQQPDANLAKAVDLMTKSLSSTKLQRLYIVANNPQLIKEINEWALRQKNFAVSYLPAPDLLPKLINMRPFFSAAKFTSPEKISELIWRGYMEQMESGDYSPIIVSENKNKFGDVDLIRILSAKKAQESLSSIFHDRISIGYMGPSDKNTTLNAKKYFRIALQDSKDAFREGDTLEASYRAKEAFHFASVTEDKELMYNAAANATEMIIASKQPTGLAYYAEQQRNLGAELSKRKSIMRDIDAADMEQKAGRIDDADRILMEILAEKTTKKKPEILARTLEVRADILVKKRSFQLAADTLNQAKRQFELAKNPRGAAICAIHLGELFSTRLYDFKNALATLEEGEQLAIQTKDNKLVFQARLGRAIALLKAHLEANAQIVLAQMLEDGAGKLSFAEIAEVQLTLADSHYWQSSLSDADTLVDAAIRNISAIKNQELSSKLRLRAKNAQAMLAAAYGKSDEAIRIFNEGILEAIETHSLEAERDLHHNFAQWLRQWGNIPQSSAQFEASLKLSEELSRTPDSNQSSLATESANLALSFVLSKEIDEAEKRNSFALKIAEGNGMHFAHAYALLVDADIAYLKNDKMRANDSLSKAEAICQNFGIRHLEWRAKYGLGHIAASDDKLEMAKKYFKEASDLILPLKSGVLRAEFKSKSFAQASASSLFESQVDNLMKLKDEKKAWRIQEEVRKRLFADNIELNVEENSGDLRIISDSLEADTGILEYFIGERSSVGFFISKNDFSANKLEINQEQLRQLVKMVSDKSLETTSDAISSLSQKFLKPFAKEVQKMQRIILIPDLHSSDIPFEALSLEGDQFFETKQISYAGFASKASPQKEHIAVNRRLLKVLAVIRAPSQTSTIQKEKTILPRFFPDSQILDEKNASKELWLAEMQEHELLHISAPAVLREGELRNSYLQIGSDSNKNNHLTIREITKLKKMANLTVLPQTTHSAYLPLVFQHSGSNQVLSNLHGTDELSNTFLVKNFYRIYEAGRGACEALQLAQKRTKEIFPHPSSWANFRIFGGCEGQTSKVTSRIENQ